MTPAAAAAAVALKHAVGKRKINQKKKIKLEMRNEILDAQCLAHPMPESRG